MLYSPYKYRETEGSEDQQNTIDRAKGIIAKPMPETWYNRRSNVPKLDDSEAEIEKKNFDMSIVADRKPYFMIYVYPHLKKEYDAYYKNADFKSLILFGRKIDELLNSDCVSKEEMEFLNYYKSLMPVGDNPCVINRISWIFEKEFNGYLSKINKTNYFDYNILKSNTSYSVKSYNQIVQLYNDYNMKMDALHKKIRVERFDDAGFERKKIVDEFIKDCFLVCTNEDELCNIVLDICYAKDGTKQFAWDVCGSQIIKNLLKRNGNSICFPEISDNECFDFKYMGICFKMNTSVVDIIE